MLLYLVIISLILHLGTILWIIILMQKINASSVENDAFDAKKVTREIEDLLIAYTAEMKAENEKLINEFIAGKEKKTSAEPSFEPTEAAYKAPIESETNQIELRSTRTLQRKRMNERETDDNVTDERFSNYQPPTIHDTKEETYEQSDTLKVFTLAKQGFSIDEIAKKLNMGKGEVELLLKFYQ